MHITLDVPDTLPRKRIQQRLKELEASLREEAKFLETVQGLINNFSEGGYSTEPTEQLEWLGCMSESGKISGDILEATNELVSWEVLEK